jgi:serine/threonine-protein kinase RsbW
LDAAGTLKLIIESKLENISLIGSAVRGIAGMLSMDAISGYQLELCVVEAVTNVTKHAYHGESGHSVEVDILLYPDRLTFKIYDRGDTMDLSRIEPLAFDPSKVESLPERGMGVFILKTLMDEISYETVNGQNILTMIKYLKTGEGLSSPTVLIRN